MKLAFLILAHTDMKQLQRLVDSLIECGDIYIHIDKKAHCLIPQIDKRYHSHQIYYITKRISIAWGGYSQIKGFEILLNEALSSSMNYDRFVFLSGLDYPIYSNREIIDFFQIHPKTEFVCGYNISQCHDQRQLQRVTLYHLFRDIPLKHNSIFRRIIIVGARLFFKILGIRKKPYIINSGEKWDIFYGSQWISITKDCGKYISKQLSTNKTLVQYFKTAYAPDELCVPTIVFNSPFAVHALLRDVSDFKEITPLHYLNYTSHIWTYDEKDFDVIVRSNKMFVRKLISNKSERLIELLEKRKQQ